MKTTRRQNVVASCQLADQPIDREIAWVELLAWLRGSTSRRQQAGSLLPRTGATLTEVLMSLMIMSIGVTMIASLFPISTLRTLEANKQTNSTIARFNAEALIDVDPQFIHNPDAVFPPGGADLTPYNGPMFRARNYFVDPVGYQDFNYDLTASTTPLAASPVQPAIPAPPAAPPPVQTFRDYYGNNYPAVVNLPLPRRYTGASLFTIPYPTSVVDWDAAKARATELVTQPDNWKLVTESQITGTTTSVVAGATGITGLSADTDADFSSITLASIGVVYRAVIYDIDGTHSETRTIYNINAGALTLDWIPPAPGTPQLLPARFNTSPATGASPNVGRIRIEQADQVYTWMLSVRKRASGPCNVDVVVFFKRNFDPNHERVFDAEFRKWRWVGGVNDYSGTVAQRAPGISGADDNGNTTADDVSEFGYPILPSSPSYAEREEPNAIVTLKVPSIAPDEERPKPRRGGYIYDTKNGLWYRIRAVQNQQYGVAGASGAEDWVDVVLDETIKLDSTEDLDGDGTATSLPGEDRNGNGAVDRGGAILHPSVVNVFPLEIKEP